MKILIRRSIMSRVLLTILALIMLCNPLFAAGGDMGGGNGSQENPYLIEDFDDFQVFCNPVTATTYWAEGVYTRLDCNLDLDPAQTGLPIYPASVIGNYSGIFDGNNNVISNLTILSGDNNLGLFGQITGDLLQIKNLGIENASVTGEDGPVYGEGAAFIGALCGYKDGGIITNCYSTGSVTGGGNSESVGGLCGKNYKGSITYSYSTASVTGSDDVGGLCGKISYGDITNCYAAGTVTGISSPIRFAGLCGYNYDASIINCYAAGLVTWIGDFYNGRGGLCANNSGIIESSFWDVETSTYGSQGDYEYTAIGKTTAQMKDIDTFFAAGWDFVTDDGDAMDWFMLTGDYPKLVWQVPILYSGDSSLSLTPNTIGQIQIEIFSPVDELVSWTISGHESCGWITNLAPTLGESTGPTNKTTVMIDLNSESLPLGDYSCDLTVTTDSSDTFNVPVSLHVYNRVDIEEFAQLAQFWQATNCNNTQPCSEADWYKDRVIDNLDLRQLAVSWLGEEIINVLPYILDDFMTGDLTALDWVVTGNAEWAVVLEPVNGTNVAKSGSIGGNQTTSLELTVDVMDLNTISFDQRVSSENNFDWLRFYIDDVLQGAWSGQKTWTPQSYDQLTPGQHTFRWTYSKDGSLNGYSDCAWIDNVRIFNSSQ